VKRPWQIWTAYGLCLVVILSGMAWLTWRALALDRAEAQARREADEAQRRSALQERVALALWRMDWTLSPLIAQETTRPSVSYRPFLARPGGKGSKASRAELASPLLTQPTRFVVLNFDVADNDQWVSPQCPPETEFSDAVAAGVAREVLARNADHLKELQSSVTFAELLARVPQTLLPADDPGAYSNYFDNGMAVNQPPAQSSLAPQPSIRPGSLTPPPDAQGEAPVAPQPAPQQAQVAQRPQEQTQQGAGPQQQYRDEQEYQRRNMGVQNIVSSQRAQVVGNTSYLPTDNSVQEGTSRPMWIGDKLVLARRVVSDGQIRVQGCWLDWPAIKRMLQQEVADLFPALDLLPTSDATTVAPGRLLATLPVQMALPASELGGAPVDALKSSANLSAIRISLVIAWCCLALGGIASAVMLHSVLALSERRAAFVSAVTHELRSPLTTFRMYAEMLAEGMVRDDQQRRSYLETLRVEADRLAHLVDNVLQYARLERGRRSRRVPIELARLIQQTTERLPQRAKQAGMALLETPPPAGAQHMVSTDSAAVEQILFNLVDNACKYASSARDRRIHLQWSLGNGVAQVRVTDHGPGISDQQLKKLFLPFSKTDQEAAQSAPGIGLGLALCQRLAADVGGKLTYAPDPAGGAAFLLELPLAP
jgi:signal transduction histidine kinase